jgi:hypothetical protein
MTVNTETPGAPADDAAADAAAAAVADQAAGSDAGAGNGNGENDSVELPFKLEEIGDDFTLSGPEARKWLTTRQAQMQAGYTRKSTELAEQRQAMQEKLALIEDLDSDDPKVARSALAQLVERFDFVLPDDDDDPAAAAAADAGDQEPQTDLEARLAAIEARNQAQDQAETQQQQEQRFNRHVVESLDAYAVSQGLEKAEDIPEGDREAIISRAVALPRLEGGLLDFDAATAAHLAYVESLEADVRKRYVESKDVPNPGTVNGTSGDSAVDLSDRPTRLKKADAIAGRHL